MEIVNRNVHSNSYEKFKSNQGNSQFDLLKNVLSDQSMKTYPQRALGTGLRTGLIIVVQQKKMHTDYLCKGPVQGFKISVHNPAELPTFSNDFVRVPLKKDVTIGLEGEMVVFSEDLKSYDHQR